MRFEKFPESVHLFNWIPSISWRLCSAAATNELGTNTYGLAIRSQNRNAYHTSDTSDGLPKEIYVCEPGKILHPSYVSFITPSRRVLAVLPSLLVIFSQNHLLLALL